MYATSQAQEEKIATLEPQPQRPEGMLDTSADSETIRMAMLNSANTWQSLWVDALIVDNFPQGDAQSTRVQLWVDRLTGRFRVLSGPLEAAPDTLQVSDGTNQARINLVDGTRQEQTLQDATRNPGWQPPMHVSDTIQPHPLDLEIDSRVSELIFPQALAERGGNYTPTGIEDVAGEQTVLVEWSLGGQLHNRFWIDSSVGIILRMDSWEKGTNGGAPVSSIIVRQIIFNTQVPNELYSLNPGGKPVFFADPSGILVSTPLPEAMRLDPTVDALYFYIAHGFDPFQLVRLPGSCVAGVDACPAPEMLPTTPEMQGDIHPLVWSPDRTLAALAVEGAVFTYSPYSETWNSIALFPMITGDPAWSPDGGWIVFSTMNEAGKDLYAARPDGADLRNLTNGQFNPVEMLWIDGFLSTDRLVFSAISGVTSETYTLDLLAGKGQGAQKVDGLSTRHGVLAVLPDAGLVAFSDQQDGSATLNLLALENGQPKQASRRLTMLSQAAIQEVLFSPLPVDSPENPWIAFLALSSGGDTHITTVYAIRADGADFRQLYQEEAIWRISFTADGEYLIAEGGDSGRLVIIGLDGTQKVLDAPGLRLDHRLLGASWK